MKNEYPKAVIDFQVKMFLNNKINGNILKMNAEKIIQYLVLPFTGKSAEVWKKRIVKLIRKYYPQVDFRVMFKAPLQIGGLFPFKDKIPTDLRSMVVYRICCKDCGMSYIGKTERSFSVRLKEHRTGKSSNVHTHMIKEGHQIDWEGARIIDVASNNKKLLLKEMLHINKYKPGMNIQKQSYVFSMLIGHNSEKET